MSTRSYIGMVDLGGTTVRLVYWQMSGSASWTGWTLHDNCGSNALAEVLKQDPLAL